jgi:hypothetical protein
MYRIELALKARICVTLKWTAFPETSKEFAGLSSFKIHDLDLLLHLSGVETKIKTRYMVGGGNMGTRSKIQTDRKRDGRGRGTDDPISRSSTESAMTALLEKLAAVELALSRQRGEFELFGLFLRNDAQAKWDLIASAPWLRSYDRASLQAIVTEMQRFLTTDELLDFSRVVVLDKGNPFLETLLKSHSIEHDKIEGTNLELLNLTFRRAFIITARRRLAGKNG